jgi:hypothetical protein
MGRAATRSWSSSISGCPKKAAISDKVVSVWTTNFGCPVVPDDFPAFDESKALWPGFDVELQGFNSRHSFRFSIDASTFGTPLQFAVMRLKQLTTTLDSEVDFVRVDVISACFAGRRYRALFLALVSGSRRICPTGNRPNVLPSRMALSGLRATPAAAVG